MGPELLLGPILRHVSPGAATVWVEVSAPCQVQILGTSQNSFMIAGHHYALVPISGLEPGTHPYRVHLDGVPVWPLSGSADPAPPSVIRIPAADAPSAMTTISFGSCRVSAETAAAGDGFGVDALEALARRLMDANAGGWPDLLVLLGDQVYADLTSPQIRRRIDARRGLSTPPGPQIADFEEYTWLYQESWSAPAIRWLFSVVPIAMIFDDHDVHDDWNTSRAWRSRITRTDWWPDRITGGLMAYWIYQHAGNLSPEDLSRDPVYAQLQAASAAGRDGAPALRVLAEGVDQRMDGVEVRREGRDYRWSFVRDIGRVRLVVLDSRCGRVVDGERSMLRTSEFAWAQDQFGADVDHLLIGTSLPWLLAPSLHVLETWNERSCRASLRLWARCAERLRQNFDLEHWPAFNASFDRLVRAIVHTGRPATAPATICVLSGDVHHSYLALADLEAYGVRSRVFQVTCSPFRNSVAAMRLRLFGPVWNPVVTVAAKAFGWAMRVPRPGFGWRTAGPVLIGNVVGTLVLERRRARLTLEQATVNPSGRPGLAKALVQDLASEPGRTKISCERWEQSHQRYVNDISTTYREEIRDERRRDA